MDASALDRANLVEALSCAELPEVGRLGMKAAERSLDSYVEGVVAERLAAQRQVVTDVLDRTDWSDKSAMALGSAVAWALDNHHEWSAGEPRE